MPPCLTRYVHWRTSQATRTGRNRALNEDTAFAGRVDGPDGPIDAWAVFDGVAGLPEGQAAAQRARDALPAALRAARDPDDLLRRLHRAVAVGHGACTGVVVWGNGEHLHAVAAGDARLYRMGASGLQRLNPLDRDPEGRLTGQLGTPRAAGHVMELDAAGAQAWLLCTDGLAGIGRDHIQAAMEQEPGLSARRLVQRVASEASDDASAVMVWRG